MSLPHHPNNVVMMLMMMMVLVPLGENNMAKMKLSVALG